MKSTRTKKRNNQNTVGQLEKETRCPKVFERACSLVDASKTSELFEKYLVFDQKIVTSKVSDYNDTSLITTKVKDVLEQTDARTLKPDEKWERNSVLWLWYHHGISYAMWGYKDKKMARRYSTLAIKYLPEGHGNRITKLLFLLIRDRYEEALEWSKTIKGDEHNTAKDLLAFYKKGGFFK